MSVVPIRKKRLDIHTTRSVSLVFKKDRDFIRDA